jgi:hypothetical protein
MYKVYLFIQKKPELSMAEFKDYYENHHIPLLHQTLYTTCQAPIIYKRNYLEREKEIFSTMMGRPAIPVDFDVVTEMVYEDQNHFQQVMKAYGNPEVLKLIKEDEMKIIAQDLLRAYVVDEAGE